MTAARANVPILCTQICMYARACTYKYMHTYSTHAYMYVCIHAYTYICSYRYMPKHKIVRVHAYTYDVIHIYAYVLARECCHEHSTCLRGNRCRLYIQIERTRTYIQMCWAVGCCHEHSEVYINLRMFTYMVHAYIYMHKCMLAHE